MVTLPKPGSEMKILIVDDTPDNLRLLAKMLESQGYIVRKALNGRMALQGAYRDPPDLILLDINMPEMNGYEVCQQLKTSEVTQAIPVIFISALDQANDKVRAFELGGQDYITKPFQELEVLARIRNQLLIQQQRQQLLEQQTLLTDKNQQLELEIRERKRVEAEVRSLNTNLENHVAARTLELQQALSFQAALKEVADRVRDSLDQHQILQMAVESLGWALDVHCCDAALYNPDHQTSTIRYQWVQPGLAATQGQTLYMADVPELYEQLQQQLCFAFCQIQPSPIRNHSAILACPIFDDQVEETGILGDLWLFKPTASSFDEIQIHLVQQVANQCAIALRQARLYEAAQAQVKELQRLNQLKDDFLSTISHELRTPIASMKMIIKLIMAMVEQAPPGNENISNNPAEADTLIQYLTILQEECDRELGLVEDLLSLQHLEAGTHPQRLTTIQLSDWILHIIEPFEMRTQNQQQVLQVDLASNLPTLCLDPFSLNRILTELLNNACKYTPAGGTIAFSAQVIHPTTGESEFLQLAVSNTGVMIAPEEIPRIFDKFYRILNHDPWKYGGTGLGLALVKKLVEQMGGAIQAGSTAGMTQFIVQLPFTFPPL